MRRLVCFFLLCTAMGCNEVVPLAGDQASTSAKTGFNKTEEESQLTDKVTESRSLVPAKFLDGHLEISLPSDFREMSEKQARMKYPKKAPGELVFTDQSGSVNVLFKQGDKEFTPADFKQMYEDFGQDIRQIVPGAQWIYSGKEQYHGRDWIQFEYRTDAIDTKIHVLSIMSSAGGRMLTITFNVTEELSDEWLDVGREIIKSAVYTD